MLVCDSLIFRSAAVSHPGQVRALNEDAWLACDRLAQGVGLWAVADGMGGHQSGEVASQQVVAALGRIGPPKTGHEGLHAVERALQAANAEMRSHAERLGAHALVGSTAVVLFSFEGHYACLWSGDSRAYLYREGRLSRLTRDDRLIQPLVDSGLLSREQARRHPQSNVLTRALGASDEATFSLVDGPIRHGDTFLLCSDGLSDLVEDEELADSLDDPGAADGLVRLALARGAPDNVTCLIVQADGG